VNYQVYYERMFDIKASAKRFKSLKESILRSTQHS